jgi:hypothetical protein
MTRDELKAAIEAIPDATIKAVALARVDTALQCVQRAQDELSRACEMLSPLCHGAPAYSKCGALRDRVHSFWYVLDSLRGAGKVRLDSLNLEALAVRMAEQKRSTTP